MTKKFVVGMAVLLLGSWFIVGKKSVGEKITLIVIVVSIYVGYKFLTGSTMEDIIAPFMALP